MIATELGIDSSVNPQLPSWPRMLDIPIWMHAVEAPLLSSEGGVRVLSELRR
jgi:hypothetical protein